MFAQLNGSQLFYEYIGPETAPPVVFLHGMSFSHRQWHRQIDALLPHYRLLLLDLRGHGQSDVGDAQYTQRLYVDDLIALLDELHIRRATLCGLSLGGAVAMRTALDHPERVSGLVLCNTRADDDDYEDIVWRERVVQRIKKIGINRYVETFLKTIFAPGSFTTHQDAVQLIRETMLAMSPLAMCGALLSQAARPNLVPRLFRIKVPTLVIAGELDTFTPPSLAETIADSIPGSVLRVLKHSAHLSPLEDADEFNAHLLEFLPLTHDHRLKA